MVDVDNALGFTKLRLKLLLLKNKIEKKGINVIIVNLILIGKQYLYRQFKGKWEKNNLPRYGFAGH